MAKAISLNPVESFVIEDGESRNLFRRFEIWLEELDIYIAASGVTNKAQKRALLLYLGGKEIREIYKPLGAAEDNYEQICTKLLDYFKPRKNVLYERYKFKQAVQKSEENTSTYVTRLKNLAKTCEFNDDNMEIRDAFVATCNSTTLKKKLLKEDNLTLENLVKTGKDLEILNIQTKEMEQTSKEEVIEEEIAQVKQRKKLVNKPKDEYKRSSFSRQCEFLPNLDSRKCYKCGEKF